MATVLAPWGTHRRGVGVSNVLSRSSGYPASSKHVKSSSSRSKSSGQDVRDSWLKPTPRKRKKADELRPPSPPRLRAPDFGTFSSRGSSAGLPPMPVMPDFSGVNAALANAQTMAVNQLASLEASFQRDLDLLRSAYQLAETDAEKAQIRWQLDNLKAQRVAGEKVIQTSYREAIRANQATEKELRERGARARTATTKQFQDAAAEARALISESEAAYANAALGLDAGGVDGAAADIIASLLSSAAREGQFAEQMELAAAQEIAALGESLRGEQSAQIADLQRLTTQLGAAAQMEHAQRVNSRIAQERAAMAQALINLGQQYSSRQWDLQGQLTGLGLQQAQMLQDQAMVGADLQNRWAQQVWQTQREDSLLAQDLRRQQAQQQFELDAQLQAQLFEQQMSDYLRRRDEQDARQLAARIAGMSPAAFQRNAQLAGQASVFGVDPSIFLR